MRYSISTLDIATWFGLIIFATSSVIIPICLPDINRTIQASLSENGSIETVRNLAVLFVLVLAGVLAQYWSKKRFIAFGQYLVAIGLLSISFSNNYLMLIFSIVIVGLGGGLSEAFINPIIVDIHPRNTGKYLNFSNAFYPIGVITAALLFGELLTMGYSWRFVFRIASGASLLVGIFFNILKFPNPDTNNQVTWENYTEILTTREFWIFAIAMFLGGGIESALTFWGTSYVKEYLSEIPRAGAIAVMIFAASMAVGRFLTAYLSHIFSLDSIIMGSTVIGILIGYFLPKASNLFEFYLSISLAGIATACFWPTILAKAKSSLNVNITILFIMLASTGVIGFGVTPIFMGIIGDISSLRFSFFIVPAAFVLLLFILIIERKIITKNIRIKSL